ncbi:MAG: hypothetical protein A2Z30_07300 [Chloroflexi bacterium RBG_16_64_43]|nr:MAG: hypothetical protein A2Z30_07300 [Chloroflexi bacterium RBG_16_64_43]
MGRRQLAALGLHTAPSMALAVETSRRGGLFARRADAKQEAVGTAPLRFGRHLPRPGSTEE